jgi:hypothetical protein
MADGLLNSAKRMQQRLADASIDSAIIGGIAVSVWGEPRLTQDTDIRVALGRDDADQLLRLLGSDYVALAADPARTLRKMGFLFLKDADDCRIDILLADTPYDALVIGRAKDVEVQPGLRLSICTAEDLIIYKMISTRGRDRDDVVGIIRRQGNALDDAYVLDWLRQFEQALDDSTLVATYQRLRGTAPRSRSAE